MVGMQWQNFLRPEIETKIQREVPLFLAIKHSVVPCKLTISCIAINQLDPCSRFDTILACDRHRPICYVTHASVVSHGYVPLIHKDSLWEQGKEKNRGGSANIGAHGSFCAFCWKQYVAGCRLDEVWRDFIYDLVALRPFTTPPTLTQLRDSYRRLLTVFRQSAAKLVPCFSSLTVCCFLQTVLAATTDTHHLYHMSQVLWPNCRCWSIRGPQPSAQVQCGRFTKGPKGLELQISWIWCRSTQLWYGNCLSSSTRSTGMEVARGNGNIHWASHMFSNNV